MKSAKLRAKAPKKAQRIGSRKDVIGEEFIAVFHDDYKLCEENLYTLFELKEPEGALLRLDLHNGALYICTEKESIAASYEDMPLYLKNGKKGAGKYKHLNEKNWQSLTDKNKAEALAQYRSPEPVVREYPTNVTPPDFEAYYIEYDDGKNTQCVYLRNVGDDDFRALYAKCAESAKPLPFIAYACSEYTLKDILSGKDRRSKSGAFDCCDRKLGIDEIQYLSAFMPNVHELKRPKGKPDLYINDGKEYINAYYWKGGKSVACADEDYVISLFESLKELARCSVILEISDEEDDALAAELPQAEAEQPEEEKAQEVNEPEDLAEAQEESAEEETEPETLQEAAEAEPEQDKLEEEKTEAEPAISEPEQEDTADAEQPDEQPAEQTEGKPKKHKKGFFSALKKKKENKGEPVEQEKEETANESALEEIPVTFEGLAEEILTDEQEKAEPEKEAEPESEAQETESAEAEPEPAQDKEETETQPLKEETEDVKEEEEPVSELPSENAEDEDGQLSLFAPEEMKEITSAQAENEQKVELWEQKKSAEFDLAELISAYSAAAGRKKAKIREQILQKLPYCPLVVPISAQNFDDSDLVFVSKQAVVLCEDKTEPFIALAGKKALMPFEENKQLRQGVMVKTVVNKGKTFIPIFSDFKTAKQIFGENEKLGVFTLKNLISHISRTKVIEGITVNPGAVNLKFSLEDLVKN